MAPLQCWDTGWLLCPEKGVKGPHCGKGCNYGSDLIPGLGTPYTAGWAKKEKEKKKFKHIPAFLAAESSR